MLLFYSLMAIVNTSIDLYHVRDIRYVPKCIFNGIKTHASAYSVALIKESIFSYIPIINNKSFLFKCIFNGITHRIFGRSLKIIIDLVYRCKKMNVLSFKNKIITKDDYSLKYCNLY